MFLPAVVLAEQAELIEPRQSDVSWILLAGMVQPFVTELLTKQNVNPGIKRVVNVLLAACVGAANAIYEDQQNGGPFDWKRAMVVAVGVWLTSATAYVHLWKDTAALKKVDAATANFGVGTKDEVLPDGSVAISGATIQDPGPLSTDYEWTITAKPIAAKSPEIPPPAPPTLS